MTKPELIILAKRLATAAGMDPVLCCAMVEQESAWNPYAIRYEPAFLTRYVEPLGLKNKTEVIARSCSWGLMQVMGQVAREHGFTGKYLSELCDPEVAIRTGLTVFSAKLKRANGDISKALLFWNGGGRKQYPDEVLARLGTYTS